MGSCQSRDEESGGVMVINDIRVEIEKWNSRREDVLKNLDALTKLYLSMDTRKERIQLIEENIEIFKEFFNLPHMNADTFQQIEYMFQEGLNKYVKSSK